MTDLSLNCESHILTDEVRGDTTFVDVYIDSECVDPDGGHVVITRLKGEWQFGFHDKSD